MIADAMLDTNVLVYAASRSPNESRKRDIAMGLVQSGRVGLSAQTLQEFYVAATRKAHTRMSVDDARDWIEEFQDLPVVPIDRSTVLDAIALASRYQISYWDGAIIAAAQRLQAQTLYTEDLNDGQRYGSVTVVNPFKDV